MLRHLCLGRLGGLTVDQDSGRGCREKLWREARRTGGERDAVDEGAPPDAFLFVVRHDFLPLAL